MNQASPVVALITDFGTADWFAGEMKGTMLATCPGAAIVDITHQVPPGDIRAGAFVLAASYRSFPANSVFCVVVDPGVGSDRAALVIKTRSHTLVGPDNGVLSWALRDKSPVAAWRIENKKYLGNSACATFHGRDVFGPVAAHLACGVDPQEFGPSTGRFERLDWPEVKAGDGSIAGTVLYIDRFGNAITNLDQASLTTLGHAPEFVHIVKQDALLRFATHFQSVGPGQGLGYIGSAGFVEIGVNGGSASERFKLSVGDQVEVR